MVETIVQILMITVNSRIELNLMITLSLRSQTILTKDVSFSAIFTHTLKEIGAITYHTYTADPTP